MDLSVFVWTSDAIGVRDVRSFVHVFPLDPPIVQSLLLCWSTVVVSNKERTLYSEGRVDFWAMREVDFFGDYHQVSYVCCILVSTQATVASSSVNVFHTRPKLTNSVSRVRIIFLLLYSYTRRTQGGD